jgi:hypothetical protein
MILRNRSLDEVGRSSERVPVLQQENDDQIPTGRVILIGRGVSLLHQYERAHSRPKPTERHLYL